MSVYRRPGSSTYSYDFRLRGRRFSGATEAATKREALKAEATARANALAKLEAERAFAGKDITFEAAASRYWHEVGQHHRNSTLTLWSMDWLTGAIGKGTRLSAIDDSHVALLVAKRRADLVPGRKTAPPKPVSPATVNRTVTEPLRKIMTRARDIWGVKVQAIRWRGHLLPEPRERVREASSGEEAAIMGNLGRGYDDAILFAFLSGCRRGEVVGLEWSRVDFFGRQFTVIGKGGHSHTVPMSQAIFELLWRLRGHHEATVFTYVAARTDRRKELVKGQRYPITASGLQTAMRRAVASAGVPNFRLHDTRHTAATRTLRASNLKVVQSLLGHADISTTAKYAHALVEDVRAALDAATPTRIATETPEGVDNQMQGKGKAV